MAKTSIPTEEQRLGQSLNDYYVEKAARDSEMVEYMMIVGTLLSATIFFILSQWMWQRAIWEKIFAVAFAGTGGVFLFIALLQFITIWRRGGADR